MSDKKIQTQVTDHNNTPVKELEGLTPNQLHNLLYDMFSEKSPLQFNQLADGEYDDAPVFAAAQYLAKAIVEEEELKLTASGYIPPKLVKAAYSDLEHKCSDIESGLVKLRNEMDYLYIHLSRILLELTGIIKKQKNRLSITKKGQKIMTSDAVFYETLMNAYCAKFNWGYFGGIEGSIVGRLGCGFTLFLLNKFGSKEYPETFYADKYFTAFPTLVNDLKPLPYMSQEKAANLCYCSKTFTWWLDSFGLVKIEVQGKFKDRIKMITRTPLFSKLISFDVK